MEITQNKLIIKQKVEALEIFTDFETKNRYELFDENSNNILYAYEESGFASRFFLKVLRPLKLHIIDSNKQEQIMIDRKFFILFADHLIYSPDWKIIGKIRQRFGIFKTIFEIYDQNDQLKLRCVSKFPHIWTYNIFDQGSKVGQILKKWSGAGREMFTDADTFLVDLGTIAKELKPLVLACAFAIDLRKFERK